MATTLGHYELGRELGRGGMGAVHEARDRRDDTRVAVKTLHPWLAAGDSGFRERFEREAHLAALLRSPHTVHLLDYGVSEESCWLVMEFIDGQSLAQILRRGPMHPRHALRVAADIARALEEAGSRGVVHRDIKPENVLVTAQGAVKVTDFGIARQEAGTGMTQTGTFIGTAAFASPEQATGEVDRRSDIYSLGATLYCMLAGRPPFDGRTAFELLQKHRAETVPMWRLAHLPDAVSNPVRRCLEKDPRDRYQTAGELIRALERASAQVAALGPDWAPPPPPTTPPPSAPTAAPTGAPTAAATTPFGPTDVALPSTVAAQMPGTTVAAPRPQPPTVFANAAPAPPPAASPARLATGVVLEIEEAGRPTAEGQASYRFRLRNESAANVVARIAGSDPSGLLGFSTPAVVTLAPGESTSFAAEVRERRRVPGHDPIQFQMAAHDGDGRRLAFVNTTYTPALAPARRGNRGLVLMAALAGVAIVGAVVAVIALSAGG